jgi:transposase
VARDRAALAQALRDGLAARVADAREIINGIFYVMRAGCPWRLLPNDLPPWGTIYRWFAA